jgi:hypothetical protein
MKKSEVRQATKAACRTSVRYEMQLLFDSGKQHFKMLSQIIL